MVKKWFLKKLNVWLTLIKIEVWVVNFQKWQYIYIKELLFLIISLNVSYGHNIFTKISRESLYDKLLTVDKKIIISLIGPNEN